MTTPECPHKKKAAAPRDSLFNRLLQLDCYFFPPPLADFFDALAFFAMWPLALGICPAGMEYLIRKALPEVH
jgi:hypothetical protein